MNKKQYNNVIDWTLTHDQSAQTEDSLKTARAIFKNMGVALPQGDLKQVSEVLKTDDYMGWRSCTMQEAQAAADKGIAAIGISEDKIVVLSATDEEQPVATTASVMTLSDTAAASTVSDLAFYSYNSGTTVCRSWSYYANQIVSIANSFLGKTEAQIEQETEFNLANGQWCVDFVRLCCKMAGVYDTNYQDIIPTASSSTIMRNAFRDNYSGTLHEGMEGIQAGDIVFVANDATSTNPYHTCIALSGVDGNGKVDTINGNWGAASHVATQKMPVSGCAIGWYAHPDYEKANNR